MENPIALILARFSPAARRARKIEALRQEAQHHAEMAELHVRAAQVYATQADELLADEIADELAAAGLPETSDSDFNTFDEAARAHG